MTTKNEYCNPTEFKQDFYVQIKDARLYDSQKAKLDNLFKKIMIYTTASNELIMNVCDENVYLIKNISLLAYIILKIFNLIAFNDIKHSIVVLEYFVKILIKKIENNDNNVDNLKKNY